MLIHPGAPQSSEFGVTGAAAPDAGLRSTSAHEMYTRSCESSATCTGNTRRGEEEEGEGGKTSKKKSERGVS
eukprot:5159198-Pleurochrysis_carterae.AAC.3